MAGLRDWLAGTAAMALVTPLPAQPPTPQMDQKAVEAALDRQISGAEQLGWMRQLAAAPNHLGSPHDKANAEYLMSLYKSWGWDAHIETFSVLYPTPISTTVEMVAPERIQLGGQEPPIAEDETSKLGAQALPPYVAYQGDGDVTAPLVYVNYGMPDDYKALERRGIDVRGKIVIARYGVGWRGLKPKLAQDHGAAGCIIYSDPAEDGYAKDDVYPKGGMRPPESVQRGSVMDMPIYPGDPLTPGVGATQGAKRLTRATAQTILKIPVLPMNYADAGKLLGRLAGPVAPQGWAGALPFTYHIGGSDAVQVHLAVKSKWDMTPVYDVIATMRGAKYPDEWVIRGNHHDGWVAGASDPLSGNVAMLSEAKAIGGLVSQGWRPARTIVYASWDGEEPSLLGSTEWAETHEAELKKKAVLYVNTDGNGRGVLEAEGSHDWQHLVNQVAADVIDPETNVSVAQRLRGRVRANAYDKIGSGRGESPAMLAAAEKGGDLPIGPLGSGSDYSAYLQHLGLPAINLGYGGEGEGNGVYHSLYDSYYHFTHFVDPDARYGETLAKTAGRLVLRVADADTPPMRFGDFADTVATYLEEVRKLADDRRAGDVRLVKLQTDDAFRLASDPTRPVAAPGREAATPHIELAALANAVDKLKTSAAAFDAAYATRGASLDAGRRQRLNALLRDIDQLLLDPRGLPGRPWYRNLIYAPGRFTGYGAKTLPGVREAIEEHRFADADLYAGRTATVIEAYATRLDQARSVLTGS